MEAWVECSTFITSILCDSLHILRTYLNDPNNVLQSWDPTLINPCTWYHVTCNNDNHVIRVDLGNAGLSGSLVPSLSNLTKLQYLQLEGNNITGVIPREFGNFKSLISLGLQDNHLTGSIPSSLGNLRTLRFLRLDGNHLSGKVPAQVIQLVLWGNLQVMNVSDNNFAGTIRNTRGNGGYVVTTIVQDPRPSK